MTTPHQLNQQQGQNSPFRNIRDSEKRIFVLKQIDTNPDSENISYEVLLDEKEDGIETTHVNRRFFSKSGYEITPVTVAGICGSCHDVTPTNTLQRCNCGRQLCPSCRRKIGRCYYCKWKCVFFAIFKRFVKSILMVIKIPLEDIYGGYHEDRRGKENNRHAFQPTKNERRNQ